jgi:hypothetical protein
MPGTFKLGADNHMLHLTRQITASAAMKVNRSLSPVPAILSQDIQTYPRHILEYPRDILLDIHGISFWYPSDILSYPDIS